MKFLINIIVLYLVTFQMAFGQTLINTDQVEIGKKGSTAVKQLKFRTTNQKSLSADYSTEGLSYDGNSLSVGDGTASNKTLKFNKGANSPEIRFNNATGKLEFSNDASLYKDIGSGSGGTKNYITETDGTSQGNWTTYADAAGTSPVDGTGGVPTVTYVASTDSTMRGTTNFLFTHPASNVQGNGFSYNFTIDPSDEGKVLQASLEYKVASGTFADNDLDFWIYDVTNATLIQPAPYHLKNSGIIEKFAFEFQTASNSTSYRLIGHVATATATAYTLRFTNWNVGPQAKLYGSPITDLVNSGAITIGATTTAPTKGTIVVDKLLSSREGQNMVLDYQFEQSTAGTNGSGDYLYSLPSGYSFDSNNISFYTGSGSATTVPARSLVGWGRISDGATVVQNIQLVAYDSTHFKALANYVSGSQNFTGSGVFAMASPTLSFQFKIKAPMAGASSSQVMSSDADTRVMSLQVGLTTSAALTPGTAFKYDTVIEDTHGCYSVSTGLCTIPSSGRYKITAIGAQTTSISTNYQILKNGVGQEYISGHISTASTITVSGSSTLTLKAGDTIGITASVGVTLAGGTPPAFQTKFLIEKISGPSQIMASETVSASYWLSANFTSSVTIPINFDSKEWDTHNAVSVSATAWKFTAPISGTYIISETQSSPSPGYVRVYKNGTFYKSNGVSSVGVYSYTTYVKLLAGEYVDLRFTGGSVYGGALANDGTAQIQIEREGNY